MRKIVYNALVCLLLFSCQGSKKLQKNIVSENGGNLETIIESYQHYVKKHRTPADGWTDDSSTIIQDKKYMLAKIQDQMNALDISTLSNNDVINYEMLKIIVDDIYFNLDYDSHLMPLNAEGGFIIGMVYQTQNKVLNSEKSIENYFNKLRAIPSYIDQKISLLDQGLASNKTVPKLIVSNCIAMLEQYLSTPTNDLFLMNPVKSLSDHNKEIGHLIVSEKILPSFQKLKEYLEEEYMPNTKEEIGVYLNDGGKEYYEQRVRYFTTLEMSPDEVYETGLKEVKRIRAEMEAIIEELKFEGSYSDFLNFLRTDPQFYVDTPQELLNHAAWLSKKAEEILPRYFGKLPRLPFTVNPVPASIAPNYTTGRYSGGSMTNQRAGQYWVNTYNLPSRPTFVLPALTLHEAVPGHHLQISLAKELEGLPSFRNTYLSAFGEGWGLYAEYLGKEAGIYTTPYEDFGRLTYEMWRACRLVVDPGMHYKGWTREEAVDFMASNTALSLHEVNTEINRYIGWPGQAVSYKIGELKIRELRKSAEKRLRDKFDIREFHDLVLSNGSIPLSSLERIVHQYINESLIVD